MRITREELGANVRLSDPTLYRNVTLPLVKAALTWLEEPKLASALEKLGTIFGAYGEWGQPIHGVGNDVRLLGLPIRRPDTEHAFRMLCRHNRYVQEFGRVRDADEMARRERVWERRSRPSSTRPGHEVGAHPAARVPAAAGARRSSSPPSRRAESSWRARGRSVSSGLPPAVARAPAEGSPACPTTRLSEPPALARPGVPDAGLGRASRDPRFMQAMAGAMRGKEKLEKAVGRVLRQMNVPTRSELKRAVARIDALEKELAARKRARPKARVGAARRRASRAQGGRVAT